MPSGKLFDTMRTFQLARKFSRGSIKFWGDQVVSTKQPKNIQITWELSKNCLIKDMTQKQCLRFLLSQNLCAWSSVTELWPLKFQPFPVCKKKCWSWGKSSVSRSISANVKFELISNWIRVLMWFRVFSSPTSRRLPSQKLNFVGLLLLGFESVRL